MKSVLKTSVCALLGFMAFSAWGEDFDQWKQAFRQQAISAGVAPAFVDRMLPKMQQQDFVIKADRNQSEKKLDVYVYLKRVITPGRIEQGQDYFHHHYNMLMNVYEQYHVPPQYLLAFWGAETHYGTYMGKIDILSSLATLAYDKRRRTFFTKELIALLKIMQENGFEDMQGSWAGAFGHFQFMPSTFLAYAIDENGDGKKDLCACLSDAFSSAAHYLSSMGWQDKQRWGRQVILTRYIPFAERQPERTIAQWAQMGVEPANKISWNPQGMNVRAHLTMPMGPLGPAFLTYKNFKIIMRWNKSTLYALSIGLLADQIAGQGQGLMMQQPYPELGPYYISCVQDQLKMQGYDIGKIDGILGSKTLKALEDIRQQDLSSMGCLTTQFIDKALATAQAKKTKGGQK